MRSLINKINAFENSQKNADDLNDEETQYILNYFRNKVGKLNMKIADIEYDMRPNRDIVSIPSEDDTVKNDTNSITCAIMGLYSYIHNFTGNNKSIQIYFDKTKISVKIIQTLQVARDPAVKLRNNGFC